MWLTAVFVHIYTNQYMLVQACFAEHFAIYAEKQVIVQNLKELPAQRVDTQQLVSNF